MSDDTKSMYESQKSVEERLKDLEGAVFQQALMNKMLMDALSKSLHDHEAIKALIEKINIELHGSQDLASRRQEYIEWLEAQAKIRG
jgi:hypothetical protein